MSTVPGDAVSATRGGHDRRRGFGPVALTLPALAGLLVLFVAPFLTFAAYSVMTAEFYSASLPLTLDAYGEVFGSAVNAKLATNAFLTGLFTATATVALSLPVAFWLRYAAGRYRTFVLFMITATLFASYLVRIYAWRSILGRRGLLNTGLESLGLIDEPLQFLLYNRFAVTIALVHIFLPFTVLVLYAALAPVTAGLLEASQDLGADARRRWTRVILPLVAAPAATAFVFVFVLSAADYVTPQFLGGTNGGMIGVRVQQAFTATGDWSQGAATAICMLVAFLLVFGLAQLGLGLLGLRRIRFVH